MSTGESKGQSFTQNLNSPNQQQHSALPLMAFAEEKQKLVQSSNSSSSIFPNLEGSNKVKYELLTSNSNTEPCTSNASALEKTAALICYSCSSICMTVTNRYVFSAKNIHVNFMLLLAQSVVTVGFLWMGKGIGLLNYQPLTFNKVNQWFHVVCLLVGMIFSSSKGLQYLNVANFTVCKNIMIVFMAMADVMIFRGRVNNFMLFSFVLVIAGGIVGCASDLNFSPRGYTWLAINCFCSGGYLIEMRRCIAKVGFKDFDTVYYNNILSVPILLGLSCLLDDWKLFVDSYWRVGAPLAGQRELFVAGALLGCISAFAISFASAWCLRILSSTTYSIAGSLNKLPVSISGLLFFPSERNFSLGNLSSIGLSFAGGVVYTAGQLQMKRQKDNGRI
jgi:GDP-mannose transporter